MKQRFLTRQGPMLTVMLQCETPEVAIGRIRNANALGADAYGLQVESLLPSFQQPETLKRLFSEMGSRPCYVTNYRRKHNTGKTDETLAGEMVLFARTGGALIDVMGDLFCPHPLELTEDPGAIRQQQELIRQIHDAGAAVMMSSHVFRFTPAREVLAMAREQKRRGADIIKLVTGASTMAEQLENLQITELLSRELDAPFLFLSGGQCSLHRRLGIQLGCCMALCVYEHDALSTSSQPLLSTMKTLRDGMLF